MTLVVDSEMPTSTGFGVGTATGTPPASPQTFSFTNTAGTVLYLVVVLSVQSGGTTAFGTVTYNGVAMTKIIDQTTASGASRIGVFRLLSPATGSNTVSIAHTMATSTNFAITAGCISFTGNDMVTPEVQTAGSNGSGTSGAGSLTGVASGNITVAGIGAGTHMTAQTQTLSWANNLADTSQAGNGRASRSASTGSVTHGFTIAASDSWATAVFEVAAAATSTPSAAPVVPVRIPNPRVGPMALRRRARRVVVPQSSPAGQIQTVTAAISSTASVSATLVRDRAPAVASISSTATVTATVVRTRAVTATISSTAAVSATLVRVRALTIAAVNSTAAVSVTLLRLKTITVASVSSIATVTTTLVRTRALTIGQISSTATVTGTVVRIRVLTPSQMTALTTVTASVVVAGAAPAANTEADQQIPKVTLAMRPH